VAFSCATWCKKIYVWRCFRSWELGKTCRFLLTCSHYRARLRPFSIIRKRLPSPTVSPSHSEHVQAGFWAAYGVHSAATLTLIYDQKKAGMIWDFTADVRKVSMWNLVMRQSWGWRDVRCKLQTHGAEQLLELWLLRLEIVWRWQWSIPLCKIVALIVPGGCGKSIAQPHNFHDSFAQTARATCKKPPWQWHELRWNGSVLQFQTFGISTLGKWV